MKAVLIGNYGVGNFGDEALKDYFLETFREVEWTVLSAHPRQGELPRLPIGVRSFVSTPWWKTVRTIRGADAVVFGGGTLFTDIESLRACVLWGLHAAVARFFRVPIILAFQGVGPFETRWGEGIARWVFRRAMHVSVRDGASAERVRSWKVNTEIIQTFDPIFLLFLRQKKNISTQNVYMLIPRHTSGVSFAATLDEASIPDDAAIEVLTLQPDHPEEQQVVARLCVRYPRAVVRPVRTTDELMEALAHSVLCICERFHGALAAVAAGVPLRVVSQASGDKLDQVRVLAGEGGGERAVAEAGWGEEMLRAVLRGEAEAVRMTRF